MRILITGGAGFIGHHLVESVLINTDWEVIILDKLTYASNGYNRLRDAGYINNPRLKIFSADFSYPLPIGLIQEIGYVDYLIHLGAETHVDNSILHPENFVMANVVGTMHLLNYIRDKHVKKFVYFSTDEVFGPAPKDVEYKEWDRYNSTNPYSASKAAGEELCLAYANTYKLPIIITHTMNCFGERQHPEKFIPSVIRKIIKEEIVFIHSDPTKTRAGSRFYIHCRNVAAALLFLLDKSQNRDKYNIVGEKEVDNLEMAKFIAKIIDKPLKYELIDFHSSRPGHDLRYALDGNKMRVMGWNIPKTFEESLIKTIRWYLNNSAWLEW